MRVYVGTYAKYNQGSLKGEWIDLKDYTDKDGFIEACRVIHSDETDPELMFQDHEDIPEKLISESHISEECWELLDAYADFDEDAVKAYCDYFGKWDRDDFRDKYIGKYYSWEEYVEQFLSGTGKLDELPDWARNYFDFTAYARDVRYNGDVVEQDGYFFFA